MAVCILSPETPCNGPNSFDYDVFYAKLPSPLGSPRGAVRPCYQPSKVTEKLRGHPLLLCFSRMLVWCKWNSEYTEYVKYININTNIYVKIQIYIYMYKYTNLCIYTHIMYLFMDIIYYSIIYHMYFYIYGRYRYNFQRHHVPCSALDVYLPTFQTTRNPRANVLIKASLIKAAWFLAPS